MTYSQNYLWIGDMGKLLDEIKDMMMTIDR